MKVEVNPIRVIQRLAAKSNAKSIAKKSSGGRAINFGENRSFIHHGESRRLFVPRSDINGGDFASGASRLRAMMRMVSRLC